MYLHAEFFFLVVTLQYGAEKMSLPSTAANKPVVLPKMGQVSVPRDCKIICLVTCISTQVQNFKN